MNLNVYGKLTSIVMEFCNKGDLLHKINLHKKTETLIDEKDIWSVIVQVLLGL